MTRISTDNTNQNKKESIMYLTHEELENTDTMSDYRIREWIDAQTEPVCIPKKDEPGLKALLGEYDGKIGHGFACGWWQERLERAQEEWGLAPQTLHLVWCVKTRNLRKHGRHLGYIYPEGVTPDLSEERTEI